MKDAIIYILLLFNILAADTYWLLPFILTTVLLVVPMYVIGIGTHTVYLRENWQIARPFLLFFCYIFIVQLFRFEEIVVSAYSCIMNILTVLVALYFKENSKFLVWYFVTFTILNLGVQLIQMAGFHITAETLLGPLGFKSIYGEISLFDSTRGFRYSGLFVNVVPLGFLSGTITAFFWILYNHTKQKKHLIIALCGLLMSVLTNTRAVIYSIVPIILIVDYIIWRRISFKVVALCLAFLAALTILQANTGYKSEKSSMDYSTWTKDGGVVDRIQGNVYGVVGTLSINPIFGVSEEKQGEAIREGYNKLGLFFGDRFINHTTYHNLPLYYLRVYGILGFILFLYAYCTAIKYAYNLENPLDRQFMLTVLLFFFVYNLSHNMKINYLVFWMSIFASYQSLQQYFQNEEETDESTVR